MPNPIQTASSRETVNRKANPDGTITVLCRICGRPILRMMTRGFATATCTECQGLDTSQIPTGEIILPDGRMVFQSPQSTDAVLYTDEPEMEKVGLARAVFRALGFRRKKPKPAPTQKSREVAKSKQRKPLFGPEDEEK